MRSQEHVMPEHLAVPTTRKMFLSLHAEFSEWMFYFQANDSRGYPHGDFSIWLAANYAIHHNSVSVDMQVQTVSGHA